MERLFPPFAKRERQFLWALSLVAILCAGIPLLVGVLRLPPEKVFIGFGETARNDNGIYLSYIEQARTSGHVFFANVFAAEPHTQSFFQPLWAVIGLLSWVFHLAPALVFHIVRLASIPLLVLAIYRFTGLLLPTVRGRIVATTLGVFGSGVGLYFLPFVQQLPTIFSPGANLMPADITMPQFTVFQSIAHSPLFILTLALLVFLVTLAMRDEESPGQVPRSVFFAGTLLLALLHPYDAVILIACVCGVSLLRFFREPVYRTSGWKQSIVRLEMLCLAATAALAYFVSALLLDHSILGWAQQNVTPSPSLLVVCISYGVYIPLWLWQGWKHRDIFQKAKAIFLLWPAIALVLSYSPTQVQSRFLNGLSIVLAVVVGLAVEPVWQWAQRQRVPLALWLTTGGMVFAGVLCPSTWFTVVEPLVGGSVPGTLREVYQFDRATLDAMHWLRQQAPGLTLSADTTSFVLSSQTLRSTYISDGSQTPNHAEKFQALRVAFPGSRSANTAKAFFQENHIRYLFWTEQEKQFFAAFSPQDYPWLHLIFQNQTTEIYAL
ncbi:MAG: hypothetical protein WCV85_04830 [Patescibacteria group bacterium]|jgi:hypothetical protein